MAGESVQDLLLRVQGDSSDARLDLDRLAHELEQFDREEAEAEVRIDDGDAEATMREIRAELERFDHKHATATVEVDGDRARLSFQGLTADSDRTSRSFSDTERRTIAMNQGFDLLGKHMSLLKWPTLIAGAGTAAQAVSALVGGAGALASALGPALGGLLVARAQGMIALGQAMLTIRIAQINDITAALQGNKEALKRLGPDAQHLVEVLKGFSPEFDRIRSAVQAHLFAGLGSDIQGAMRNLPVFRSVLTGTADALNDLAHRAAQLLGSASFGRLFQRVGQENTEIIHRLGVAALDLVPALLRILDAARPLMDWMTRGIKTWAENTAQMIKAKHESGDLARFFGYAKDALAAIIGIASDVGHALFNIAKIGRGTGMDLLHFLGRAADKFREWTESASGQNQIRRYFHEIEPPLKEAMRLVGDVIVQFFKLGKGGQLTPLLHEIRTDLLPLISQLAKQTSASLGPKLIPMLRELAQLFLRLAGNSGPLSLYIEGLTRLAQVLNFVFDTIPGVQTAVVDLMAAFALYKTLGGPISLITQFIETVTGAKVASLAAAAAQRIMIEATYAYRLAVIAAGSATRLAVGATGIGALILVATLIATHWDQTKKVLAAVWNWIKGAAHAVGQAVAWAAQHGFLGPVPLIIAHWRDLVNFFKGAWGWIKGAAKDLAKWVIWAAQHGFLGPLPAIITHWKDLRDFFKGVWDWMKRTARDVFGALKDAVLTPIRAIRDTAVDIWDWIRDKFRDIWDSLKDAGRHDFELLKEVVLTPIRAIRDVAVAVWDFMRDRARDIWGAIKSIAHDVWEGVKDRITAPIRAVRDILSDVWGFIKDRARDAWDGLRSIAHDAFSAVKEAILTPIRAVKDVVKSVFGWIRDRVSDVVGWIEDRYHDVTGILDKLNAIKSALTGGGTTHIGPVPFVPPWDPGGTIAQILGAAATPRGVASSGGGRTASGARTTITQNVTVQSAGGDYPDADYFAELLRMKLRIAQP